MFQIVVESHAVKGLRKLPKEAVQKIIEELKSLPEDPRRSGSRKIVGTDSWYRIRVGDYRIVYEIDDERKRVLVQAIGHRKDVYRW
jgi:mRNA interferase RelE/StbE